MYSVGSSCVAISFQDLFNVDPKPENVDDAVKFIHRCRQIDWPCQHRLNCVHRSPNFRISEKSVAVDVCSKILAPLCNEVILERMYREDLERILHPPTLTYGDIGLGTTNTWHGTPDIRVRAGEVNFLYSEKGEGDAGSGSDAGSDARSDEESDGMTTVIEAKLFLRVASLPQVVAMNVVSSSPNTNYTRTKSQWCHLFQLTTILSESVFTTVKGTFSSYQMRFRSVQEITCRKVQWPFYGQC